MAQWYSTCFESKHTGVKSGIQVRVLLLAFVAYWDKRLVHRALTPEVAVRSRNRPFLPWWLNWYSSRLLICYLGVISGFGVQVPATALDGIIPNKKHPILNPIEKGAFLLLIIYCSLHADLLFILFFSDVVKFCSTSSHMSHIICRCNTLFHVLFYDFVQFFVIFETWCR